MVLIRESCTYYRNEEYQEALWQRSFEFLKEQLSPGTGEKYGPPGQKPAETDSGEQYQDQQSKAGATGVIEAATSDE